MEIPHFGSMRAKERELIVLRSDNGDTWREHQSDGRPEDLTELLGGMDEGEAVCALNEWAKVKAQRFGKPVPHDPRPHVRW